MVVITLQSSLMEVHITSRSRLPWSVSPNSKRSMERPSSTISSLPTMAIQHVTQWQPMWSDIWGARSKNSQFTWIRHSRYVAWLVSVTNPINRACNISTRSGIRPWRCSTSTRSGSRAWRHSKGSSLPSLGHLVELGSSILGIYGLPSITRHTMCRRIVGQMKYVALCDCHCMWMWMWPLLLPNNSNTNQLSSSHHHGYLPRSPYKHLPTSLALSTPHTNNMPIFQPSSKFIYQDPLFFLDLTPSQHKSRVPTAPSSSPTLITTTTIPNNFIASPRHLLVDRNIAT